MSASRGVLRAPLPTRSTIFPPRTQPQVGAAATTTRAAEESPYPATIQGRRRSPVRSETQPETSLTPTAIASAIPSITPTSTTGAPSVSVRNSGTIGYASSLAESFASETQPSTRTFRGSRFWAATIHPTGPARPLSTCVSFIPASSPPLRRVTREECGAGVREGRHRAVPSSDDARAAPGAPHRARSWLPRARDAAHLRELRPVGDARHRDQAGDLRLPRRALSPRLQPGTGGRVHARLSRLSRAALRPRRRVHGRRPPRRGCRARPLRLRRLADVPGVDGVLRLRGGRGKGRRPHLSPVLRPRAAPAAREPGAPRAARQVRLLRGSDPDQPRCATEAPSAESDS